MTTMGVWAPDEATFWASMVAAGLCTAPGDCRVQVSTGWAVLKDGAPVPGFHANIRADGEDGAVLAAYVASLSDTPADGTTGFPAGKVDGSGVKFCSFDEFSSPANVWA